MQPFEFLILGGSALGIFVVANPLPTIKDTGHSLVEAILDQEPKQQDFLNLLGLLHALMREMRSKSRGEVEAHIDNPQSPKSSWRIRKFSTTSCFAASSAIIAA